MARSLKNNQVIGRRYTPARLENRQDFPRRPLRNG